LKNVERTAIVQKVRRISTRFAFLFVAGLLLFEGFARFGLGLGTPPLSAESPTFEYWFAPNQDVYRFGNHFQTNAWGMRSPAFSAKKFDPTEFRIMVFGDSVINGGNLTDQSELATTLIQQDLSKQLTGPVVVGNISAGSWGPGNWRAYADEFGFFDADCVIVVVNVGDIGDCPTFGPLNPNTHPTKRPWCATSELFSRYLPRYLPSLFQKTETIQDSGTFLAEVGLDELRQFLMAAKIHVGSVHVMQFLDRKEILGRFESPELHRIRALCGELQIPIHSTRDWFPIARIDELFRDDIHPDPPGQRQLANAILGSVEFSSIHRDQKTVQTR
jgi:hypothetical protein